MSSQSTTEDFTPEQLSAEQIRSQMQQCRLQLDNKAEKLAEGTNSLGDWQQYVKARPVLAFAACAVAGYLLVPKKKHYIHPDPERIANLVRKDKLVVAPPGKVSRGGGIFSGVASSLLRIGMQTAAGAVMAKLGEKSVPTDDGGE